MNKVNWQMHATPEMFLKNSIERILTDPATKKKENSQLKKACEAALEQLNGEIERNCKQGLVSSPGKDILPNSEDFILADSYFLPFELACQSKSSKIVITALDSIQKLINHKNLVGDSPDSSNPEHLLIDRILQAVCQPFQGPQTDEAIQLQIITTILTIVLSENCPAHEGSLLLAVRTCFNIYLASRSQTNQATARGVLTQTIDYVFTNMERQHNNTSGLHVEGLDLDEAAVRGTMDSIVNQIAASDAADSTKNTTARTSNGEVQSSRRSSIEGAAGSGASLALNGLMNGSATNLDSASESTHFHEEANISRLEFQTVEEKDAFLIFRALCKLSMKQLPNDPDPRSHELRSKLLSLEMILLVMQNFNCTTLTDKHSFIFAIRHFLCVALTHNAVSPIISVFEKALAVFVHLVNKLKVHLKRQVEVFFKEIIISILESSSSSFEHKWVVMNTIAKICNNSQSVVDIYVNYDCHLTSANIFEALVTHLSKIASGYAQDTSTSNYSTVVHKEKERRMRELGLECLIKVLQCLVVWYEELHLGKSGEMSTGGGTDPEESGFNGTGLSGDSANHFMHAKHQKGIIESGIELFARKPKQGLAFLQEKGFVGQEAVEIAKFFYEEERLDKGVAGDFLGDGNEFNKAVMYAYVDMFDFTGCTIVQALRSILDKFRLPGEAQKIDRIMEKFASRYCECNPGLNLFASADTAYVLSYSIIMLTTDLHNAQVRKKITKEEYIKMNRGINDQGDLPDEFLCQIYDDISVNEIKTKPTNFKRPKLTNAAAATWRQRKMFQNLELESISQTAHALMEAATYSQTEFTSASHFEHAKQMFTLVWTPCLAAFSIGLHSSDEEPIWQRCLQGFRCGIRVACVFRMTMQREAYIQALTRFTLLTVKSSLSDMKSKNVESIKLLITIGDEDGNFLDKCWYDVLKCISQLELAQSIGTGTSLQKEDIKHVFNIDERSLSTLQECLGETSSQSVVVAVDRIFQGSSKLSGEAIVHFVRELCQVSLEELSSTTPRMFMLQKIVEISFYNMQRIRIEWSMIWNVLGEHFNLAGCSSNATISHFALDALRQLSMKFLEKGELPNFRLQKEFLRPFEVIMERNKSLECREMIVACVTHMVQSHADKIRSGWKNVFSLFTKAASENRQTIVEAAFKTISFIMTEIFPVHFIELMDSFQEMIQCLSEFACNVFFPDTSMDAIRLIQLAAKLVSQNTRLINSHQSEDENHQHYSEAPKEAKVWLKGWFPIIFELSCIISRCKLDVRTRSLTVMFEIIKTYGKEFNNDWWTDLFRVIFRIFDYIKLTNMGENEKNEWMTTTANHALYAIVDVFTQYYTSLAPILLGDIYKQMFWCVEKGGEQLARAAINCLENLIMSNGLKFTDEMWESTLELLIKVFECSMPDLEASAEISNSESSLSNETAGIDQPKKDVENSSPSKQSTQSNGKSQDSVLLSSITCCIIQIEVVDAVSNILFGRNAFKVEGPTPRSKSSMQENNAMINYMDDYNELPCMYNQLSEKQLSSLIKCLMKSHKMARLYNNNHAQRTILWKAAFKGKVKPNLQKLEAHSMHCVLNILFQLFTLAADEASAFNYGGQLQHRVKYALNYYTKSHSDTLRSYWLTVIQMLLNRTYDLPAKRFAMLGPEYRLSLAKLILGEEQKIIREALHKVLERSICENAANLAGSSQ